MQSESRPIKGTLSEVIVEAKESSARTEVAGHSKQLENSSELHLRSLKAKEVALSEVFENIFVDLEILPS